MADHLDKLGEHYLASALRLDNASVKVDDAGDDLGSAAHEARRTGRGRGGVRLAGRGSRDGHTPVVGTPRE